MLAGGKEFHACGNGSHTGGESAGIGSSLQRTHGLLELFAGWIGFARVIKSARPAEAQMAKRCRLIDRETHGTRGFKRGAFQIAMDTSSIAMFVHGSHFLSANRLTYHVGMKLMGEAPCVHDVARLLLTTLIM